MGETELSSHILVSSSGLFMKSWIAWCRGNHLLIEAFKAVIHLEEMKDHCPWSRIMYTFLCPLKYDFNKWGLFNSIIMCADNQWIGEMQKVEELATKTI